MPLSRSKNVAILTANATVAERMETFLEQTGVFDVEHLQGGPPGADGAHLVVVDVDSGAEAADRWIRHCDGRQLPMVVTGVERSRSRYSDRRWLSRPFTREQLVGLCRQQVGLDDDDKKAAEPDQRSGSDTRERFRARPTVEIPAGDSADEPGQGGADPSTADRDTEELLEVLEVDGSGSMILEVEELNEEGRIGGTLVEAGRRRKLETDQLAAGASVRPSPPPTSGQESQSESRPSNPQPAAPVESTSTSGVTTVSSLTDRAGTEFSGAHQVANLIAEHWDRLGLTARPADRADRLQRILSAMVRDGMEGVLEEFRRIPPVKGFSGRLETTSMLDLLHIIRDRGLRGRLEVGLNSLSFVLYLDHATLQDIESLGETTGALLVDLLYEQGALDDPSYRHYQTLMAKLPGESLEMKLRRDETVADGDILAAKRNRAKRLLEKMVGAEGGTFAFIDIPRGSGQPWPTQELELNVDSLVLEILRDGSVGGYQGGPGLPGRLVSDWHRAQQMELAAMTEAERRVMELFRDGQSIAAVGPKFGGDPTMLKQVARRLHQLGLLRPAGRQESVSREPSGTGEVVAPSDQQDETAVSSSWNFQMIEDFDDDSFGSSEEDDDSSGFSQRPSSGKTPAPDRRDQSVWPDDDGE